MPVFEQCITEQKISDFQPLNAQKQTTPTEVECRLFCCPILFDRCRFCNFFKLLSYRHTGKGSIFFIVSPFCQGAGQAICAQSNTYVPFFRVSVSVDPDCHMKNQRHIILDQMNKRRLPLCASSYSIQMQSRAENAFLFASSFLSLFKIQNHYTILVNYIENYMLI